MCFGLFKTDLKAISIGNSPKTILYSMSCKYLRNVRFSLKPNLNYILLIQKIMLSIFEKIK